MCSHTCRDNRRGEWFECVRCGNLDNADSNATAIILRRGTSIMVPAGAGMVLERRELGRTRKPPHTVYSSGRKRRENQACNRPATSSVTKHRRHTCYTRATLVYNSRTHCHYAWSAGYTCIHSRTRQACRLTENHCIKQNSFFQTILALDSDSFVQTSWYVTAFLSKISIL